MSITAFLTWFIVFFVSLYALLVACTFLFQRQMMYFPSGRMDIQTSSISDMTVVTVKTEDGLDLTAWYKAPSKQGRPVIVSFHGNASTMEWQSKRLLPFANAGYGVLVASYRGYNGNEGKPTEQGLYLDGRAYIQWLKTQGFEPQDVILYGESLGTGVAVQIASEFKNLNRLILESPFTSTVNVAKEIYPYLPVSFLMKDRYESIHKIGMVETPVIIAHGRKDNLVPFHMGQELFNAANDPKNFIDIPEGEHANLGDFGVTENYLSLLSE